MTLYFLVMEDIPTIAQIGELNQKAQYFQNALGVDYGRALDIISQ